MAWRKRINGTRGIGHNQMRNIYLDFDGTLVDSSARLYEVYKSIMTEFNRPCLSKQEYWELKRERQPYDLILGRTNSADMAQGYMKKFLERIESPDFLKFDMLIAGSQDTLSVLRKDNRLVLVTLRRSKENLRQELRHLKIFDFFSDIHDDFKEGVNSWEITASLVRQDVYFERNNSIIVGDTEDTALVARHLGITGFLVLSGIRSEAFLKKYQPTYIINDITQLPEYLTGARVAR